MPKTKFQEVVYAVLMTFFMVMAMEFYNTGVRMGGMTNQCFLLAMREAPVMVVICFVMGFFLMDKLAPRIAWKLVTPGVDKPVFCTVARASVTVCLMCPVMSFWATLIFTRPGVEFAAVWLETVVRNFPMAFFWQIFFCGPLVRFLFRTMFRKQIQKDDAMPCEEAA